MENIVTSASLGSLTSQGKILCMDGFYIISPPISCEPCNCNSSGTENDAECDVITGLCNCKMFVSGDTCNTCDLGYQQFDTLNPFGCSAGMHSLSNMYIQ